MNLKYKLKRRRYIISINLGISFNMNTYNRSIEKSADYKLHFNESHQRLKHIIISNDELEDQ